MAIDNFFVPYSLETPVSKLSDEQAGRLFKAMFNYSMYGEMPDFSNDGRLDATWDSAQEKLDFGAGAKQKHSEMQRLKGKLSVARTRNDQNAEKNLTERLAFLKEFGLAAYREEYPEENQQRSTVVNRGQPNQTEHTQTNRNHSNPDPTDSFLPESFQAQPSGAERSAAYGSEQYPSRQEFVEFLQSRGMRSTAGAEQVYKETVQKGWRDGHGDNIEDWRQWALDIFSPF